MTEVRPGTTLYLRVEVTNDDPPMQIGQAVVRWCRDSCFGLEFVSLTPDEWARLQHLVRDLEMQPYQRETHADQSA